MKTQLYVDNMKCGGCANSIRRELKLFTHVHDVNINREEELIEIEHNEGLPIADVKEKLFSMGYPEKNTVSGFTKITANAKSFVSCAVGNLSHNELNT